jgi:DNA-binding response OmpR family regulator
MPAIGSEILIIDDDALMRETLTATLESEGYAVSQAENGRDVLRLVGERHPAVVVTDILMPECDGLEVLQCLRGQKARPKVIAISGGGLIKGETCLNLADALGADAVLAKPFRAGQLFAAIESLIAQ